MKHWLEIAQTRGPDDGALWRLIESDDGRPCDRWLPTGPPELEPLDGGGWETRDYHDAVNFGLGVLWWRSEFGFLGRFRPEDFDRTRGLLDGPRLGRAPITRARIPIAVLAA